MPCWWGLTRPKQLSMASTARAMWLCAWVRYWPNGGLVFECVTCYYFCFWIVGGIGISSEKRAKWVGLTRKYVLKTRIWAPFCGPSKILIGAWINTKELFLMRTREPKFHSSKKIGQAHEKYHHQFDFTITFKRFKSVSMRKPGRRWYSSNHRFCSNLA